MSLNPAEGIWPADDLRRAFVAGATWWEFTSTGATMWNSDRHLAEWQAENQYPGGKAPETDPSPGGPKIDAGQMEPETMAQLRFLKHPPTGTSI